MDKQQREYIHHLMLQYILKAFRHLGAKKAGTTILVKSSVFASQQTLVIPAALGRYYPVK